MPGMPGRMQSLIGAGDRSNVGQAVIGRTGAVRDVVGKCAMAARRW